MCSTKQGSEAAHGCNENCVVIVHIHISICKNYGEERARVEYSVSAFWPATILSTNDFNPQHAKCKPLKPPESTRPSALCARVVVASPNALMNSMKQKSDLIVQRNFYKQVHGAHVRLQNSAGRKAANDNTSKRLTRKTMCFAI